jgi:hypothetical protein
MTEVQPDTQLRPLHVIAREIRKTWVTKDGVPNVNYAAEPYLAAMETLSSVNDMYFEDRAAHVVVYFLSNARAFGGTDGKRIKNELRAMVGQKQAK